MKHLDLSLRQMIEIDGCTRCGECAQICPVYGVTRDRKVTALDTLQTARDWALCRSSWLRRLFLWSKPMSPERLDAFSKEVFQCTLCGHCEVVCPVGIRAKDMRVSLRRNMAKANLDLPAFGPVLENLNKGRNILYPTNEERWLWLQNMPKIFPEKFLKRKAEVVYFVGCVASFFPMTYSIPQATVSLLEKAEIDLGLLGTEEWCCGWPLIGMGKEEMAQELMTHNIEAVQAMGAKTLVCGCPSCYAMWKHHAPRISKGGAPDFEIVHSTEYLLNLLKEERLSLHPLEATVTYHDPCDLGRGLDYYDIPREIIRMIPEVNFTEMKCHRSRASCCGGGGDLEMSFPQITKDIADRKIEEITETGASIVLSACQQCKRTISVGARRSKKKFKVLDIAELIFSLCQPETDPLSRRMS